MVNRRALLAGVATSIPVFAQARVGLRPALLGSVKPLLHDLFGGPLRSLNGKLPSIGPAWATTGVAAGDMVSDDGEMYQAANAGQTGYGTAALQALPGELSCRFKLDSVTQVLTFSGSPVEDDLVVLQITPSGAASAELIFVPVGPGDSLDAIAANSADAINLNAVMISNGVTASALNATVSILATEMPQMQAGVSPQPGSTLATAIARSVAPVMAFYPTGANFLDGMVHLFLRSDGLIEWSNYDGGNLPFTSLTQRTYGLSAGVEYVYRACIDPPYVWGGVWQGSRLRSRAVGFDATMPTYFGASVFLETLGIGVIRYLEATALRVPSVPRSAISSAL